MRPRAVSVCSFLVLVFLLAGPAHAGSGRFHDGKFDIYVTLTIPNPTPAQLGEIQERFTQASELLYDLTDHQARFGEITIFTDNEALEFADVMLTMPTPQHPNPGEANAGGATLGVFGESMDLFYNNDISDYENPDDAWQTIAHEFSHYAFHLFDEYSGPNGAAHCVDPPSTACIMDAYKDGGDYDDANEFCWQGNHDMDQDTGQSDKNGGKSCWETIHDIYPMLPAPAGAPDDPEQDEGFVGPSFQFFDDPVLRVVLVLDRSGSMSDAGGVSAGVTRIDDLNTFAKQFIDMMGTDDVELGIVAYNSVAHDAFPVTLLDSAVEVNAAKAAVPASAGGKTNIGGALDRGRYLATASAPSGPMIIILMTDGYHNYPPGDASAEPLNVLPSIVGANIHVHTVALGDETNEDLLRQIAKDSGGMFWKANNSFQFAPIFASLGVIARGGSPLDSPQTHPLAPGEAHVSANVPGIAGGRTDRVRLLLHPVFVEKGNQQAEFHLGWSAADAQLEMTLVSPSGKIIRPDDVRTNMVPDVRLLEGSRYRSYIVRAAESGLWQFAVWATANPSGTTYAMQPTVINPEVRGFANAQKVGPIIHLEASARDQIPITKISMQAWMTDPAGGGRLVPMWDDGDPAHGDETAEDGTYSANIAGLEATGNGVYHFEVTMRAAAGTALVIEGEEPPPNPDNRALYSVRDFWRSFAADVVVNDFPGRPKERDPNPDGEHVSFAPSSPTPSFPPRSMSSPEKSWLVPSPSPGRRSMP